MYRRKKIYMYEKITLAGNESSGVCQRCMQSLFEKTSQKNETEKRLVEIRERSLALLGKEKHKKVCW